MAAELPHDEGGIESDASPEGDAATDAGKSGGASGDPCAVDADCKGKSATCVLTRGALVYPGGSCTSTCDPAQSDPANGRNPGCPGTRSVCNSRVGKCLQGCTARTGASPCRDGYSCFDDEQSVCGPTAISQCDPTKAGGCPAGDGGSGSACIRVGLDPVGICVAACSVFTQDCTQSGYACFVNAVGEGTCLVVTAPATNGQPCTAKNDCAKGFGCAASGVCRPYCSGPNNVACSNGKSCIDFDTVVKKATVGLCDG